MKTRILCYGDSNTWGAIPITRKRYDESSRYTKILQNILGEDFEIIEEGLPSRTVDKDNIKFPKGNRNGSLFFGQCILSHDPLDYVLIMLGTNDLKTKFNSNLEDISRSLQEKYIDYLKKDLYPLLNSAPQIIIVAPGEIRGWLFDDFDSSSEEKSKRFNSIYRQLAIKNDCIFIDNQNLIAGEDGVHLSKESHQKLAEKIFSAINTENTNK